MHVDDIFFQFFLSILIITFKSIFACKQHLFGGTLGLNGLILCLPRLSFVVVVFQEMCDSGFESMQQSHKRALEEMRAAHKEEVERLQQEKETVLEEETQATHAGRWRHLVDKLCVPGT